MITDAQLKAAVSALAPDRIQGFKYGDIYVVRDLYRLSFAQELWRGADEQECRRRLGMERLRLALEAALNV